MWNCPYSNDYLANHAENFDNEEASLSFAMLSEVALGHKITIIGGSIPEWNNGPLYNTCYIFGPDGKLKAKHRKVSTSSFAYLETGNEGKNMHFH